MEPVLALSLPSQVEQIGALAGFASLLGLAVLSLLYFAQARELRRLRDWAGRAPERALELEERVARQAEEAHRVGAEPRTAPAAPAATAPAATEPAAAPATEPAVPAAATAAARSGAAAPAPSGGGEEGGPPPPEPPADGERGPDEAAATPAGTAPSPPAPAPASPNGHPPATVAPTETARTVPAGDNAPQGPGVPEAPRPAVAAARPAASRPAGGRPAPPGPPRPLRPATAAGARAPEPEEPKRHPARALALGALGAVLVAGAALAGLGLFDSGEDESGVATTPPARTAPAGEPNEPVPRSETTVAVLNGTTVTGLAAQVADRLKRQGFDKGPVTNAADQERSATVVLYREGARPAAAEVARLLKIDTVEPLDVGTAARAGDRADVVVVVGADQTP